jgi:RND family efflux transporter MFP subunit
MREIRHICLVLPLGLLATIGCASRSAPDGAGGGGQGTTVSAVSPQRKALRLVVEQPGAVQAYEQAQLFARVPGYVRLSYDSEGRIASDIGKEVKAGDVLAELVVPELEEETKQKQALVRQTLAEVDQADKAREAAKANVTVSEAGVTEAQAFYDRWESESKRMANLARSGVVDTQAREETLNQFKAGQGKLNSARAVVQKTKADHDKAEADVRAVKARLDVAHADARRMEAMLAYGKIRAPFAGVVTARKVSTGAFVQPGGGKDDYLFTVARMDPVRVVVAVPEADAELVRDGAEVNLSVQALPGAALPGKVARTAWALEPAARTLRVEIDLPNKEGRLRPGMYVYAHLVCPQPSMWTLPVSAVQREGDSAYCFLIEGNKAVRVQVRPGRGDGQVVQGPGYRKVGASAWTEWTGSEKVAARAVGLNDGDAVLVKEAEK